MVFIILMNWLDFKNEFHQNFLRRVFPRKSCLTSAPSTKLKIPNDQNTPRKTCDILSFEENPLKVKNIISRVLKEKTMVENSSLLLYKLIKSFIDSYN